MSTRGDSAGEALGAPPAPRRRRTLTELRQPPPGFSWPGRPAAEAYAGPWWRRPRVVLAGAVAIVVALTVLTDLPTRTTPASQLSGARGTVAAIRSDAASCAYSLGEAQRLAELDARSHLSASQVHVLDGLLSGDYNACSLTNNDLYNLVNVETSSSPVGRQLGALRDGTYEWANPYAFAVIGDLSAIVASGRSAARTHRLAVDAAQANRQLESVEAGLRRLQKAVGGNVPSLGLVTAITSLPARH